MSVFEVVGGRRLDPPPYLYAQSIPSGLHHRVGYIRDGVPLPGYRALCGFGPKWGWMDGQPARPARARLCERCETRAAVMERAA